MDLEALRDADFKPLDDAITEWSTLVKHLEQLKRDAEDELHQAALKADWAGVNAQVTREFITKTAGEFADAHTQAKTIHGILDDTRGELKQYHQQLVDAIEGGRKKNLTVIGYAGGFTVTTNVPPEGRAQGDETNKADITALRDDIQKILDKATESDASAAKVLKALADQSKLGFSDARYKDRDSAAEALKRAEELADLAKKDPEDLSVEEFDRINRGLKQYANDDLFAERFATALGPQKTLEFWAGMADPYQGNYELSRKRLDQLDDLQRNLGMTLANATQSDSVAMTEWTRKVIDIGDKPIHGSQGPMGFQVMSNLMRTGDYDDRFMTDYGTQLMATERRLTGNGQHANVAWRDSPAAQRLNRIGEDSGADPFTGYLKGLSNSPVAATEFFNQEFISKDDPDNPFERETEDGKKAKATLSNFQYLFEERQWPHEVDAKGDELHTGQNNLALALEAATTGHPAGELPTADTPPHNSDQAKLFEAVVASVSENDERLTDRRYMSDSLGQIASEYLPDINRSISDVERDPGSPDWRDVEKLFPVAGAEAQLEHSDISKFLFLVGQNEEGYSAVEVGQKTYMSKLLEYHLDPALPAEKRLSSNYELLVHRIAESSGEVSGTVRNGMRVCVGEEASDKDKDFAYAVAQKKNLISSGVGTAVGVGTSFVATPWIGAATGGVAGTVTSTVLEAVFKDAEGQAVADAKASGGKIWQDGQEKNVNITQKAVRAAAEKYDLNATDLSVAAASAARQGYLNSQAVLAGQAGITVAF